MKGDFDYKRAFTEVAEPAFNALPQDIRDLGKRIESDFGDVHQDRNTHMPWPIDSDLRERFNEIPVEILAWASRAMHFYGHWGTGWKVPTSNGWYWKFSLWADQTLRRKIGLPEFPRPREKDPVLSVQVHEGFLRLCHSTPGVWEWEEIGVATPMLYSQLTDLMQTHKKYDKTLKAAIKLPYRDGGFTTLTSFLDLSDYREKSPEENDIITHLKDSGLKLAEIISCNFKPHPFCVTSEHVEKSHGMYLDPSVAACGAPRCNLKYAEHTHEKVALLKVVGASPEDEKVNLTDTQQATLKALVPILEKHKIDGINFIKEE